MIEEKVIQPDSVTPAEQPVADTTSQPQAPNLDAIKADFEAQVAAARKEAAEAQEKFKGIKTKLDDVYKQKDEQRKQELEDQGQWKTLWEEANKTAQEKDQQITTLSQQLQEMKTSNEVASTKTTALAAISNLGAINAEQTLSLLQGKLQKNAEGKVVVLNGGVDVDSSGDTATGRWYIQEQVVRSNGDRGILLAHYDDQYIKTTEGWKFSRRFLQPHYSGPHDLSSEFQCSADRLRERNVEGVDV